MSRVEGKGTSGVLRAPASLADQVYDAIVDEICDGRLAPGTHLVQEGLAARFGTSRQPIQQAMARLKADAMVEEAGRRGLFVMPIDPGRMRNHYGVRAALDGRAARTAARRVAGGEGPGPSLERRGRAVLEAGRAAIDAGDVAGQVRRDVAFHALVYEASGNPLLAVAAEPHWRYLRRAMGDVLRRVERPEAIWGQHEAILEAVLGGDATAAERLATEHVEAAAERLSAVLEGGGR